jgi:hypothetical protein
VLRSSSAREEDLAFVTSVGPFVTAAVAAEARAAFVLTAEGSLKVYSYPEWKPLATHRLGVLPLHAAADGKAGLLYVAGIDPAAVSARPRARGHGDVFVFDLKDVLGGK